MDSSRGTANDSFENLCPKCGKPYYYIGDPTIGNISDLICQCHVLKENSCGVQVHLGIRQGWVCPKCGRVFSPDIIECPYCRPNSYWTEWEYPWRYYYNGHYID